MFFLWTPLTQELLSSFEVVLDQEATMKCAEKIPAAKMGLFLNEMGMLGPLGILPQMGEVSLFLLVDQIDQIRNF